MDSNKAGLSIRRATEKDVPLLLSFIRKIAAYEKLSNEVKTTESELRKSLFGKKPAAEAVIAYHENQPVGFAVYFHNFSTFMGRPGLYLEDLYMDEKHRGKGFGKALLLYLARLAKKRNCARFEWSVLDWNEPAIQFYKSLGAVPMNGWTVFRISGNDLADLADQASA
ncbi:MAG TPA: GNAT family N-acetyltransferase [bacterium]